MSRGEDKDGQLQQRYTAGPAQSSPPPPATNAVRHSQVASSAAPNAYIKMPVDEDNYLEPQPSEAKESYVELVSPGLLMVEWFDWRI